MGTLLEAIDIVLETHFGFGFPNGSPIGDSLSHQPKPKGQYTSFSTTASTRAGSLERTTSIVNSTLHCPCPWFSFFKSAAASACVTPGRLRLTVHCPSWVTAAVEGEERSEELPSAECRGKGDEIVLAVQFNLEPCLVLKSFQISVL